MFYVINDYQLTVLHSDITPEPKFPHQRLGASFAIYVSCVIFGAVFVQIILRR